MRKLTTVAVFCGSSIGKQEVYQKATRDFAATVCENGLEIIYGGDSVGLMGILADEVIRLKGSALP